MPQHRPRSLNTPQGLCWITWVKVLRHNAGRLLNCQLEHCVEPEDLPPTIRLEVLTKTGGICRFLIRFEGCEVFVARNWPQKGEAHTRFEVGQPGFSPARELARYTGLAIPAKGDVSPPPGYTGIAT